MMHVQEETEVCGSVSQGPIGYLIMVQGRNESVSIIWGKKVSSSPVVHSREVEEEVEEEEEEEDSPLHSFLLLLLVMTTLSFPK